MNHGGNYACTSSIVKGICQGFHSRSQLAISLLQDTEPEFQAKCFKMTSQDLF
jgi:hypothetical protein